MKDNEDCYTAESAGYLTRVKLFDTLRAMTCSVNRWHISTRNNSKAGKGSVFDALKIVINKEVGGDSLLRHQTTVHI
jgi:hypothetical protein